MYLKYFNILFVSFSFFLVLLSQDGTQIEWIYRIFADFTTFLLPYFPTFLFSYFPTSLFPTFLFPVFLFSYFLFSYFPTSLFPIFLFSYFPISYFPTFLLSYFLLFGAFHSSFSANSTMNLAMRMMDKNTRYPNPTTIKIQL